MAAQYPLYRQQRALKRTMSPQCLYGILAAGRREAACRRRVWRDGELIEPYGEYHKLYGQSARSLAESLPGPALLSLILSHLER